MSENIGMAQLNNLDRILQREERAARDKIANYENQIASLKYDLDSTEAALAWQREVHREVSSAMVERNVPIYESPR